MYDALLDDYGPQHWWPVEGPPETAALEVCVGAILVQHARWESAAAALRRLRDADALSVDALATLPPDDLEALVRGAGTYRAKARTLRSFARDVLAGPGGTIDGFLAGAGEMVRRRCRDVWGVGPETADAIVLYAAQRPTFVVDAYARRLFARLGCELPEGYEAARQALLAVTNHDVGRLGEWHALLVAHGKARCRTRSPRCEGCPLLADCPAGRAGLASHCSPVAARRD
ncbi:MAG: hypothetical protein F4Z96_08285 [Chloroflexi bacterium]|nr:hypothetical protein [Chloroflexota bacterium]